MPPVVLDSRRQVGGVCWAQAKHVSRDSGRIFGAAASTTWLKGTVLSVDKRRGNVNAKRDTTFIRALYKVGDTEKDVEIAMQSLKAADPTANPTPEPTSVEGNGNPPPAVPPPPPPPPPTTKK
ncbi:hypothetical protein SEMRO_1046_G235090.1 [Seminavis robusta]|uniref:Uncharacterized protein n=1 Tax=Seminavis robusta TaxID=568900 RepID=A0A9N8EFG3_9STRA|nr:hypothetical protein SEMRO_1046_G235090.1 [Seminavis robusta]|eukprot:Sro1046_g235090.1 n/a (123) ;mRNA; f:28254-28622